MCTPSGRVKIDQVESRFIKFYGEEFLSLFDLNSYSNNITNWIKYMLRISRSNVNPIKHLLLIRFLGIELEEFFNKEIEYKPFGKGPWICLNKICDNYYKPIIENIEVVITAVRGSQLVDLNVSVVDLIMLDADQTHVKMTNVRLGRLLLLVRSIRMR